MESCGITRLSGYLYRVMSYAGLQRLLEKVGELKAMMYM